MDIDFNSNRVYIITPFLHASASLQEDLWGGQNLVACMAICTPPELRETRAVEGAALCVSPQKYCPPTFVSRIVAGPLLWRICESRLVSVPRGPGTRIERPFCPTDLRVCGPIRGHSDKAKLGLFTREPKLSMVWGRLLGDRRGEGIRVCNATIPHGMDGAGLLPPHRHSTWGPKFPRDSESPAGGELGSPDVQVHSELALGNCRPTPPLLPPMASCPAQTGRRPRGAGKIYTGIPYYSVPGGRYSAE